jgi:mannan endo-1,6-alpha-mannosidase
VEGLLKSTLEIFFPGNIAYEIACEEAMSCTTDMLSFKGYVARWLTTMTKLAPFTAATVLPILKNSAQAAVKQCTGAPTGRVCGFKWSSGEFFDKVGAGQQMNVLAAVSSLLINNVRAPLTAETGGTSKGDPNAGSGSDTFTREYSPITTGDKAGASFLTILILGAAAGAFGWMSVGA